MIKRFLLILLSCALQSCGLFQGFGLSSEDKINGLIQEHHYNNALLKIEKKIERVKDQAEGENWRALQSEVQAKAKSFQIAGIASIRGFLKEDNWLALNEKQRFMETHLPENKMLREFLDGISKKKNKHIKQLNQSLLLLESQHMPETLKLYERLYEADAENSSAYDRLQHERDKRDQVLLALQKSLVDAEQHHRIQEALDNARAIQRVQDSPEILKKISFLRNKLSQRVVTKKQSSQTSKRQKAQFNEYGKAILDKQWFQAREILDTMLADRPSNGELIGQDTYLKEVFANEVVSARESGEQLYSEGNIEEALEMWESVRVMAPDDAKLSANIERAKRILNKVESLKKGELEQIEKEELMDGNEKI